MNKKIRICLLFLVLPVFAYSSSGGSASDPYVLYLQSAWMDLFSLFDSFKWLFGLAPLILTLHAYNQAKKKIVKESEQSQGAMGQKGDAGSSIEGLRTIVTYLVITILSLYVIYGVFGRVYAGSSSFDEVWKILVFDFWRSIFI